MVWQKKTRAAGNLKKVAVPNIYTHFNPYSPGLPSSSTGRAKRYCDGWDKPAAHGSALSQWLRSRSPYLRMTLLLSLWCLREISRDEAKLTDASDLSAQVRWLEEVSSLVLGSTHFFAFFFLKNWNCFVSTRWSAITVSSKAPNFFFVILCFVKHDVSTILEKYLFRNHSSEMEVTNGWQTTWQYQNQYPLGS